MRSAGLAAAGALGRVGEAYFDERDRFVLDRDRRVLPIDVDTGTCFPRKPDAEGRARWRLRDVRVRETAHAIFIRVLMREERAPPGDVCPGVGTRFLHRVQLSEPVGARAVIDLEHHYDPSEPIVYPALDPSVQRALKARYRKRPLRPKYEGDG